MEKNNKKNAKEKGKLSAGFEKRTLHTKPTVAEYVDYLLELHKLQGIILNQLDKVL